MRGRVCVSVLDPIKNGRWVRPAQLPHSSAVAFTCRQLPILFLSDYGFGRPIAGRLPWSLLSERLSIQRVSAGRRARTRGSGVAKQHSDDARGWSPSTGRSTTEAHGIGAVVRGSEDRQGQYLDRKRSSPSLPLFVPGALRRWERHQSGGASGGLTRWLLHDGAFGPARQGKPGRRKRSNGRDGHPGPRRRGLEYHRIPYGLNRQSARRLSGALPESRACGADRLRPFEALRHEDHDVREARGIAGHVELEPAPQKALPTRRSVPNPPNQPSSSVRFERPIAGRLPWSWTLEPVSIQRVSGGRSRGPRGASVARQRAMEPHHHPHSRSSPMLAFLKAQSEPVWRLSFTAGRSRAG